MIDSVEFNPTEFQKHLTAIATAVLDTHTNTFYETFIGVYTWSTIEPMEFHMAGGMSRFRYIDYMEGREGILYTDTRSA